MSLDRQQVLALVTTLLAVALVVVTAGGVLAPFVVALLLALLLYPVNRRLRGWRLTSWFAALVTTSSVTALTLVLALGAIPILAQDARDLATTLSANVQGLVDRAGQLWGEWLPGLRPLEDTLQAQARELAPSVDAVAPAVASVLSLGGILASAVVLTLLVPIALFFFLHQGRAFRENAIRLVPQRFQAPARDLLLSVGQELGNYLRGQGVVCAWQAAFHTAGLMLIGLQFGLLIGVLTGLSALIPIIGNTIMLTIAMLVATAQFETLWPLFAVLGIYAFAQLMETLFLVPFLIGKQISLHPLLMITAVLLGGNLFGLVGALLALPGTTVIVQTARWSWARYERSTIYTETTGAAEDGDSPRQAA